MEINERLKSKLFEEMWNQLEINLAEAKYYFELITLENFFKIELQSEEDISSVIENVIKPYFFPNNLDRRYSYDDKSLEELEIVFEEVGIVPDGWGCKLFYDAKNNIYWEEDFQRYHKAGYRISPYVDPIKQYGL